MFAGDGDGDGDGGGGGGLVWPGKLFISGDGDGVGGGVLGRGVGVTGVLGLSFVIKMEFVFIAIFYQYINYIFLQQ